MSLLNYLFKTAADKNEPLLVREGHFYLTIGSETKTYPQVVSPSGDTADMAVVYDTAAGLFQADVTLSVKKPDGSLQEYKSKLRAERSQHVPNRYEIKELVLDNVTLNPREPGHLDLCDNRIGWYKRVISGLFAEEAGVPVPFALDKGFKRALKASSGLLQKIDHYFAAKREHKFWFGK